MSDIERISAVNIRNGVQSGEILLVCAYDSDDKFRGNHLEGAISLSDFKGRVSQLTKETELVFYCA
ncbi:MAG: ArsR family transcriptional regulator [Desulforhopalus sp.]